MLKKRKRNNRHTDQKARNQTILFADDMINYLNRKCLVMSKKKKILNC